MPHQTTLADVQQRAKRLFGNFTAIQILDTLRHGGQPDAAAPNADKQTINDAVDLLSDMGLVTTEPATTATSANRRVEITPQGRSLADLLEDISRGKA